MEALQTLALFKSSTLRCSKAAPCVVETLKYVLNQRKVLSGPKWRNVEGTGVFRLFGAVGND